jgi:hypothetical protein
MGLPATGVSALTLDSRDSGTLYAGTLTGVFKSTDGAQSWSALNYSGPVAGCSAPAILRSAKPSHFIRSAWWRSF